MVVYRITRSVFAVAIVATLLAGCSAIDRLKNVGEVPALSEVDNPTARAGYKPVQMPMPALQPAAYNPNSLWRNGSRAFFKDQRAHQIGDILTVKVNFTDKANIANETQRSRSNSEDSGIDNFFGKDKVFNFAIPGRLLTADSTASSEGKGSVQRQEALSTNVAGVVTQVLPNGNLVIEGVRVVTFSGETQYVVLHGVVRPDDIARDNSVVSTNIADARVEFYAEGAITDAQKRGWLAKVYEKLRPI
jgi:flagellar L-ring protein precursor FlgH